MFLEIMSENKNKKIPKIKKTLKGFLSEEEGRISKKNVAKIAGGTIGLGLALGGGDDGYSSRKRFWTGGMLSRLPWFAWF